MPRQNLERKIKGILENHFGERAYVKRIPQVQFKGHHIDLEVDSAVTSLAIECKSVQIKRGERIGLYFSTHFSDGQLEKISDFVQRSGRDGYMVLEVIETYFYRGKWKDNSPHSHQIYVIEWGFIEEALRKGKVFWLDEFPNKQLKKVGEGQWNVGECFK